MSTMPLYEQFAETIRSQIRAAQLKPGDQLPSIGGYIDSGWKRTTVINGMRVLRAEGWVRGQPGQAVYVADDPPIG